MWGCTRSAGSLAIACSLKAGAAQLQVWVDAGDQPVPRKIVLTHKQLTGSPQWTAYLSD